MDTNVEIDLDNDPVIAVEYLPAEGVRVLSVETKMEDVTEQTATFLARQVGRLASGLRPDLETIGASKATVKFAMKLAVKNGKLTSWVSEVGAEGSVEVSVEFAR